MILRKFALTLVLLVTVILTAFSQDDSIPLPTIIAKTNKFATDYPTEKVYVQFDKPYYAVGDTIWLKAYVTIYQHQLSGLSKIVYLDMINSRDSIVETLRLPVTNGGASANITLPMLTFKEGNYHIRAYTNWMRNFDPEYFFTKNIVIGNAGDNTNPVNTHVSFTNTLKSTTESINARIAYKDQDNIALINKKVSWKVQDDDETIAKGKGTTDANGLLDINFSSDKPGVFGAADLITEIEVNYKKTLLNTFSLKTASKPMDVQFFPEGGDMINGIRTRVAFKAINSSGLGVDVKGTVTDNDNKVVAEFTSQHLGMGVFAMQPETDKTYKANVTFPNGTQSSFDLPRVLDEGINMTVDNTDPDNLNLKIASNPEFLQKFPNTRFYILAQSGGVIYYAAQTALQSLVYSASIPKSKFPTGIVQLSLLSADGDPLSERLVFIQHNDLLNVAMNTDRPIYSARQRVKLNLLVKNKDIPVAGNFSLSVINESKVPFDENAETTILSSLLLTSDLKGYIEKPNYYFNHMDATRAADLDVLMLTQGYRRFSYSDIIVDKNPTIYTIPEQGIEISGTLRTMSGIPVANGNVHLIIPDKIFATDVNTDANGYFKFTKLNIPDSSQVIISAKNNVNGRNLMLMLNNDTYAPLTKNINTPDNVVNIDSALNIYLQNTKKQYGNIHVLKEVVIKAKSEEKKPSHLDYPALVGLSPEADHVISGVQLNGCNDLLTCLKGSALGFTFDNQDFYITRDYSQGNKSTPVQVYFNGMPVETSYLSNINPTTVESVEIFLNNGITNIGSLNNTKGILVVNSKKIPTGEKISFSQLKEMLPQKNILTITPFGYAKTRNFYIPKYTVTNIRLETPDLRTTVYWNPQIITDKTGKASFEYFNSDNKGTYRALIEGLDADGNIARYIYRYKVE
jgi:hypothetical protein